VLVPSAAIRQEAGEDVIYVLLEGRARRRAVTLGGVQGDSRQVRAGVSAGDSVIVDAPVTLKDGDAVVTKREAN
jgi:hypothetical protein